MKVIEANAGFASIVRSEAGEIAGSPITRFFAPEEWARVSGQLNLLAAGAIDAVASDSQASRSDQSKIKIHWTATAARTADGHVDHLIATFEDMTAKHQADVAAARNLNLLDRLNRIKTEFLTTVSHEIRTALVGIQGFSELLRDAESLDLVEVRSYANEVYKGARRLDHMLGKMLDLDQGSTTRTVLHIGAVSVNSAVYDAIAIAGADGLKHHVVTDLDPALPAIRGDRAKLCQLVSILLSNAMKFSPQGSDVVVSSRAENGFVKISVRDEGTGMPPDFDREVFGRFQWSAGNPTTKVIGSGLGLPIAHEIVELHGGEIWFERLARGGSEFHFTVPSAVSGAV
jgi:signal transduction histidine kinase